MSRRKEKREERKKIRKYILIFIEIVLIGLMIFSGIKIYTWWDENRRSKALISEISKKVRVETNQQDGKKEYIVDFDELNKINPDTVAWLKVEGTYIEFPIVKTSNNEYYLNHSYDKSYNKAGWPFMDYKNKLNDTDKNIIIYGHNRRDSSMFGTLKNILNESWYNNEANRQIILNVKNENRRYEVFSIYKVEEEDYYIQTEFHGNEFEQFVKKIKSRSIKNFNVDVDKDDSILTLSTCADNNKYRIVLHAKRI